MFATVLAFVLVAQNAPARSQTYCTTFEQQVLPSVQGLLANDNLLIQSQNSLGALRSDLATQAGTQGTDEEGATTLDQEHLDLALHAIMGNLAKFDGLLAGIDAGAASAQPPDKTNLAAMRAQIGAALEAQKAELNLFANTLASAQVGDSVSTGNSLLAVTSPEVSGPQNPSPPVETSTALQHGNLGTSGDASLADANRATAAHAYGTTSDTMESLHAQLAAQEGVLATQITAAANDCGLTKK